MKLRKIHKVIIVAASAGWLVLGCELVVDFDRTLIPVDSTDATPDVDLSDTFLPDTSPADAADASDAADSSETSDGGDGGDADADAS